MSHTLLETALLVGCAAGFAGGAGMLGAYVKTDNELLLAASLGLYTAATIAFAGVIRAGGLGWAMTITSAAQLILMCLIGWAFLGEQMGPAKLAGIACAVAAIWLMSLPAQGAGSS